CLGAECLARDTYDGEYRTFTRPTAYSVARAKGRPSWRGIDCLLFPTYSIESSTKLVRRAALTTTRCSRTASIATEPSSSRMRRGRCALFHLARRRLTRTASSC